MAELVFHKPTKEEREAVRAAKAEKQEKERQAKIKDIPASVHGAPVVKVSYTAVGKKRVKELRRSFDPIRKEFLKELAAKQTAALKQMGLSETQIDLMRKGRAPNGYNVHHKMPLAGGGKNEFLNFILIKNDPYHTDFHKVSDLQICKMKDGETLKVKIPMPAGNVFIPPTKEEKAKTVNPALLKQCSNGR